VGEIPIAAPNLGPEAKPEKPARGIRRIGDAIGDVPAPWRGLSSALVLNNYRLSHHPFHFI